MKSPTMSLKRALVGTFGLVGALFVSGCATGPSSSLVVNAKTAGPISGSETPAYVFFENKATVLNLQVDNSINKVLDSLKAKGYRFVTDPNKAHIFIRIACDTGPRNVKVTGKEVQPIGVGNPYSVRYMNVAAMTGKGRYTQLQNIDYGDPSQTMQIINDPQGVPLDLEKMGSPPPASRVVVERTITYPKYFSVTAFDVADRIDPQAAKVMWNVTTVYEDPSRDIMPVVPTLVQTAAAYIGTDTNGTKVLTAPSVLKGK